MMRMMNNARRASSAVLGMQTLNGSASVLPATTSSRQTLCPLVERLAVAPPQVSKATILDAWQRPGMTSGNPLPFLGCATDATLQFYWGTDRVT